MSETPEPTRVTRHSSATLAKASALMASGTLVSRVLGLVRVILLAGVLGLLDSPAGNAWQTANTLPNTIYILLAGGILNVILVPSLTRAMEQEDRGRDFIDRLLTLALLGLVLITVVFTAGAAVLTKFFALSWSGEQLALAVAFAYLCLPQIFFYGAYTLLGQILNAQERFGWYMWAPVANNIVAIAGIVVFGAMYPEAKQIGPGEWTASMIWLLGGTATLGVLVQALVLLPPVLRSGFRWRPRWGFRGVGLGDASRMALWMLAVIGVSQAGMWLSTNVLNLASERDPSAAGKIVYENAFLFFILPHSLITASLITAMFTQMSRSAHAADLVSLRAQYAHGLRLLLVAIVPISLAMFILAPSVTAVLLFNNTLEETRATAYVTMGLLVGLAPYAAYILSARVFHAFQDGRTPFRMQLVITSVSVVGILIAAVLPPTLTAIGVGLSQALGQTAAAVAGVLLVRRRLHGMSLAPVRRTGVKVVAATVVAGVVTAIAVALVHAALDGRPAAVLSLVLGVPLFFGLYAVIAHRLGVSELAEAAEPVLRRIRGRGRVRGSGARSDTPAQVALAAQPTPVEPASQLGAVAGGTETEGRREYGVRGIEPGTALGGRYVLEELLARRGDDLDYWSAQDSTLDRLVAVTVLPATGEYEQMAQNVLDGARRTAGVDDPRLVRVLDVGLENDICWIVEEGLAEAASLAGLVAERPLPAEEARRVIGEAAQGMEAARRRGLHHLFLSPHALLRTREGTIKVSGVAVAAAIEQIEDLGSFEASVIDTNDLVSLLYTALTGRWPGEEMEGLRPARRLADGSLPAPSEVVAGVPGDLDALCRLVLAPDYDPRQGPQTPGELAKQLAPWAPELVSDHGPQAPDAPMAESGPPTLTRAAGASAAASAAHPPADDGDDATPARVTPPSDHAYYRTEPASFQSAGEDEGDLDDLGEELADQDGEDQYALAGAGPRGAARPVRREDGTRRGQTGIVLFLVLAVIAAGIFIAVNAFRGDEEDPTPQLPPDSAAQTTTGPGDAEQTTEAPGDEQAQVQVGDPLTLAGITSYDPQGDNDERNDIVQQAIDGREDTAWNSHTYLTPGWGSLKDGVGLVVDLGESHPVAEVEILFPQGDYGAEVLVGEQPTPDGATAIGSDEQASGTWTVTAEEPVTGRYVIIWFDRAWAGPGGEIVYVAEITVRPAVTG